MILIQATRNAMIDDLVVRNVADLTAVLQESRSVRHTGETKTEESRRVFQILRLMNSGDSGD